MAPLERNEQLNVRASEEELAMLRALADDRGLSLSDIVRTLIREAYRQQFGDKKPKPTKK